MSSTKLGNKCDGAMEVREDRRFKSQEVTELREEAQALFSTASKTLRWVGGDQCGGLLMLELGVVCGGARGLGLFTPSNSRGFWQKYWVLPECVGCAAAAAISSGNSAQIQGPIAGVLRAHYTEFNWKELAVFFPPACYEGYSNVTGTEYYFPLCSFDSGCVTTSGVTPDQAMCCTNSKACDTANPKCITGDACLMSFLYKAGAPVAVVCFLPIVLEIAAIVFACIIRTGRPTNFKSTV
eukprot:767620-Hanusia_phi.AAC.3